MFRIALTLLALGLGTAAQAETIRFGAILPLTGPGGMIGTQQKLGVQFALDRANAKGGVRGNPFDIADVYTLFPVLAERRDTRAGSMSGGQQQMLALSLAMLGTPRCLLLDEPSIGLAPNLVERMFETVRAICKSHAMTAILVEQNVAAAMKIADRVIIMNNGAIVFDGLPDEARAADFWSYF